MTTMRVRTRVKLTQELQKSLLEGELVSFGAKPGEVEEMTPLARSQAETLIAKYVDAEGYATLEFETFRGARILPLDRK